MRAILWLIMAETASKPMDVQAFLAFAERRERGRFELWRGELVSMAPERAERVRAKFAVSRALAAAIEKAERGCEAFVDGLAVAIDSETAYEPDALVNCGERIPTGSMLAPAPVIVVEVVSPGSHKRDTGLKVEGISAWRRSRIISSSISRSGSPCAFAVKARRTSASPPGIFRWIRRE